MRTIPEFKIRITIESDVSASSEDVFEQLNLREIVDGLDWYSYSVEVVDDPELQQS